MKAFFSGIIAGLCFLLLLAGCDAPAGAAPVPILPPEAGETFRLVVATDIHLISPSIVKEGEAFRTSYERGDGKQINYVSAITDAFLSQVIAEKPHALVLTGDLTLDGEKKSHQDLAKRLQAVLDAGIGVYVIPGNHDINNGYAAGFKKDKKYSVEHVTPEEFAAIYAACGYEGALYRDADTLSYVAAVSPDLWLVMLDTNRYHTRGGLGLSIVGGEVPPDTMVWLEECLKAAEEAGVRVVSATHHNLVNHSPRINKNYTLDNAEEVQALYHRYGVAVNLSGHIHLQSIASSKGEDSEVFDIVTSSLSVYTHQYGRMSITPRGTARYETVEVAVEDWARAQGSGDENLLNFEMYSYDFFYELSYQQAVYRLFMDGVDYEEAEILAVTTALLSPAYFSGRTADIREEVLLSDHYALWKAKGAQVSYEHNESMLRVPEHDPCLLEIPW